MNLGNKENAQFGQMESLPPENGHGMLVCYLDPLPTQESFDATTHRPPYPYLYPTRNWKTKDNNKKAKSINKTPYATRGKGSS